MLVFLFAGLLLAQHPDVDLLLKQLSDESIEVRAKATTDLIALGEQVEEKVKVHLSTAGAEARARCQVVLRSILRGRRIKEVLPPLPKVTLQFKEASLGEVLESFARQTKWPVQFPEAKDGILSVDVRDANPFEALEAIASGVQRDYRVDNSDVMTPPDLDNGDPFERKPKPSRVRFLPAFHKPGRPVQVRSRYAVALTRIELARWSDFNARIIKAGLHVQLFCPPDVEPDRSSQIRVDTITADDGTVLYDHTKAVGEHPDFFDPFQREARFDYPDSKIRNLRSVKGRASVKYFLGETTLTFDAPETLVGERKTHKDVEIRLKSWKYADGDLRFALEISGNREEAAPGDEKPFMSSRGIEGKGVTIRDKNGKQWSSGNMRGTPGKGVFTMDFYFPDQVEEVAAIEIVVERDFHTEEIHFEFKAVPLP